MSRVVKNVVGFAINLADMMNHYRTIWGALGREAVRIVPFGEAKTQAQIREEAASLGIGVINADSLIAADMRFETFVSHHYLGMDGDVPIFKRLGQYNLRYMYSLAQENWMFGDWNRHYDAFLCYGPYHVDQFTSRFPGRPALAMGYPRYDEFFTGALNRQAIAAEIGIDLEKPTVVWLPTYGPFSSIDRYLEAMSAVSGTFNVVLKPHPMTVTGEPERMARIAAAPLTRTITGLCDILKLLAVADYVVCDYGGPIFGALYTDRNLLLLNLAGIADHEAIGSDSPEIRVRQRIVSTDFTDGASIAALLSDPRPWSKQKVERDQLRKEYFAPYYGFSASIAAHFIANARRMLSPF